MVTKPRILDFVRCLYDNREQGKRAWRRQIPERACASRGTDTRQTGGLPLPGRHRLGCRLNSLLKELGVDSARATGSNAPRRSAGSAKPFREIWLRRAVAIFCKSRLVRDV